MFRFATSSLLSLACQKQYGGVIVNGHTLNRHQVRMQIGVLGRRFDFISLEELPGRLARRHPRPFCLFTFDDGKKNHYTEIAPELEALGVPAVFYVTTQPLSTGVGFWFDRQAQIVERLGYCPKGLELAALKKMPLDKVWEQLDDICRRRELNFDRASDHVQPMNWSEARSLAKRGFSIGAHGTSHAILTNECEARALFEIKESIDCVSREIGIQCNTFAFPNGNYTTQLASYAASCGAKTVMTTEPMWVENGDRLHSLPRIQLFENFSPEKIELKLSLAKIPGLLTNPNGTGRVYHQTKSPSASIRNDCLRSPHSKATNNRAPVNQQ